MKEIIIKILTSKYSLLAIIILLGVVSTYVLGDDNPIEEYSEEIIKEETGLDIDLTPNSIKSHIKQGD